MDFWESFAGFLRRLLADVLVYVVELGPDLGDKGVDFFGGEEAFQLKVDSEFENL